MIRDALLAARHALLRWRQARARHAGKHEAAYALLLRELYGDFTRPMAAIHVDMAGECLALARTEEAIALLKLADEARLDKRACADKNLLSCWALLEQGKASDAETRLRSLDGEAMTADQAAKRSELLAEAGLIRKAPDAARDACGDAIALAPWRLVAEGEHHLREGDRREAQAKFAQAHALLASRADAAWLRRRVERLLRDRK